MNSTSLAPALNALRTASGVRRLTTAVICDQLPLVDPWPQLLVPQVEVVVEQYHQDAHGVALRRRLSGG